MEYLTSGYVGDIYRNKDGKIIKRVKIEKNKNRIQKLTDEIKTLKLLSNEHWSPSVYNISMKNNSVNITMNDVGKTFCEWAKKDHSYLEWYNLYRQLFNIIYILHYKYKIQHGDLHCANLMYKDEKVYLIDFGTVSKHKPETARYDYEYFVLLYNDRYLVNMANLAYYMTENMGFTPQNAWRLIKNKKKISYFIVKNKIPIETFKYTVKVPDTIAPFIKKLSKFYGKSMGFYLEKFFPNQNLLTQLSFLNPLPLIKKTNTGKVIIEENWKNVDKYNKVVDKFSFHCRMKCKLGEFSPQNIVNSKKIGYRNAIKEVGECTNFNISRVVYLIKYLFPKKCQRIKWLDPSAGWGSRLLGAISLQIKKYKGVDPNSCLEHVYKKIITELGNGGDYSVIKGGFEDFKVDDEYDLVFTSPPFFDFEIYSENSNQSIKKYTTEEMWVGNFLIPMIKKGIEALKIGGYLVLYIEPKGDISYDHLFKDFDILYMKYSDDQKMRAFYILQKK